jgi:hypothetical protein
MTPGDLSDMSADPSVKIDEPLLERWPCLASGTMVRTQKGELPVEYLQAGDQVMTREAGLQTLALTQSFLLSDSELRVRPELCPVVISRNAFGPGLPCRDLMVSPDHRVPARGPTAGWASGPAPVMVQARDLAGRLEGAFTDMSAMEIAGVEYFALVFEHACSIWADGLPVEGPGLSAALETSPVRLTVDALA